MSEAWRKFRGYVHCIDYEISGFGKVRKDGDDLIVEDIRIFNQEVSGGGTTLDAMSVAKFFDELDREGEDGSLWKLWWHSHVNMPAYFSGMDRTTIKDWDTEMPIDNWMLSIVTNKMGDLFCQVDVYAPLRLAVYNLWWQVAYGEPNFESFDAIRKEIAEKVRIINPYQKWEGEMNDDTGSFCYFSQRGIERSFQQGRKQRTILTAEQAMEIRNRFTLQQKAAKDGKQPPLFKGWFAQGTQITRKGDVIDAGDVVETRSSSESGIATLCEDWQDFLLYGIPDYRVDKDRTM